MDILDELVNITHSVDAVTEVDNDSLLSNVRLFVDNMLITSHSSTRKHKTDTPNKRLNFACPYCGDSKKDASKKRGNIYLSSLWYKCYNHPCVSKPLISMVRDFHGESYFSDNELSYLSNYTSLNIGSGGLVDSINGRSNHQLVDYMELGKYGVNRQELMNKMGLMSITYDHEIHSYATSRGLLESVETFGDFNHLASDPMARALVIMNLDKSRTKVLGMQKRFIHAKKDGFRFMSYTFEQLLEQFWGVDPETLKDDLRQKMYKVSLLHNFFICDFRKPIIIVESGIDASHIKNTLGLLSASTSINLKKNGYYMYDNSIMDNAGNMAATMKLEDGYNVFLWRKFLSSYPRFRHCKDLNDLWKTKGDINMSFEFFSPFFSNDDMEILEI